MKSKAIILFGESTLRISRSNYVIQDEGQTNKRSWLSYKIIVFEFIVDLLLFYHFIQQIPLSVNHKYSSGELFEHLHTPSTRFSQLLNDKLLYEKLLLFSRL